MNCRTLQQECVYLDEVRVSEEDGVIVGVHGSIHLRKYVDTSEQDAQDVAQEAYLRAFRFFPGFRSWTSGLQLSTILGMGPAYCDV